MAVSKDWAIQQAVFARLTAELAGLGPGGTDPAITDYIPQDPARVFVRLEGFNVVRRLKGGHTQHFFSVSVYDRPTSEAGVGRGQKTAKVLLNSAIAALDDWQPSVTGASSLTFESKEMGEGDGVTADGSARFSLLVAP